MGEVTLTALEPELLEICSNDVGGGETTTQLDESLLEESPGRAQVERALRGLVARGLMTTVRGTFAGTISLRNGHEEHRVFEDDWWPLTEAGRAAIGLAPPDPVRWMNPSSGRFRVSPLLAPWFELRSRRGKEPLPNWYRRLTGRPARHRAGGAN